MPSQVQQHISLEKWILFTTYGWLLGILLVVGFALLGELIFNLTDDSGGQAAVGIGMGAGVGFMQWLIIRKYVTHAQKYFWLTLLSFSLVFILRDLIASWLPPQINNINITVESTIPITVLLGAFISAILQHKFVLNTIMKKGNNWILYSVIAWLLATVITMSISMLNLKLSDYFPKFLIFLIALIFLSIGGPVLGYITGKVIVPALNTRIKEQENDF